MYETDYILVPVGGGGLISGIALAAKFLKPSVKIIGVEPEGARAMDESIQKGAVTTLSKVDTIADGVAVKTPGEKTFSIVKSLVDEIITVSDKEIRESFMLLFEKHKLIAEGSGVLPVAALNKLNAPGKNVVCVISGGNIETAAVSMIIEKNFHQNLKYKCRFLFLTGPYLGIIILEFRPGRDSFGNKKHTTAGRRL